MVGFVAAGFVWFGWDLAVNLRLARQRRQALAKAAEEADAKARAADERATRLLR
jgi:hypothetical protein